MQESLYFTNLVQRRVLDSAGRPLGTVTDLVVASGDLFPRITGFVVTPGRAGSRLFVPLESVQDTAAATLALTSEALAPEALHLEAGEARLGHSFLDKQIVDTQGVRVVRINDLKLAKIDRELRLLGADVGVGGLFRRMHAEGALRWLAAPMRARMDDSVIPWNFVDPLSTDRVQLNVTRGRLREMRPADLADVLEQLPAPQRTSALADLSDDQIANTLSETRPDVQRAIIEQMEDERASDILERMAPDDAADLLQDLEEDRREDLLERMDAEERQELAELLTYRKDTAGGLMTTEVIRIPAHLTAEEAIAFLRRLAPDTETIFYLYIVTDTGQLEGVVSLRALITAAPQTLVRDLSNNRVHSVHVDEDQEEVAETIARYNLLAVPVVDDAGVLKGLVTIDDVIDVMREEATEDISLMSSGGTPGERGAMLSFGAGRIGWILLALMAAIGMSLATMRLVLPGGSALGGRENWMPAFFFVPPLLDVGNTLAFQASTLVSRVLSDSPSGRASLRSLAAELLAGCSLALLAVLVAAVIGILWPGLDDGTRVWIPLSLLGSYAYALLCGTGFPLAMARFGIEPTRGLRPLLIVLVSTGGLAIYFGLLRLHGGV